MDSMVGARGSRESLSSFTNVDEQADFGSLDFANPLASNDVLNDFDFDSFLHDNEGADGGFDFSNTGAFMDADGIET